MELPTFRYHPDPIASGSVIQSDNTCRSCGQSRGYIYTGPVYSEEELDDALCPWCIADGSAHRKFEADFMDSAAFSGDPPEEVMEEIVERTPGFSTWQSESWPCCCDDAAAFIGPAGIKELRSQMEMEGNIMSYIVHEMGISGGAARRLAESLHKDQGPTAYVFQCLHCRRHLFHIDQP
jgi:uncharacterized protein CbrC (UPF0167 family)